MTRHELELRMMGSEGGGVPMRISAFCGRMSVARTFVCRWCGEQRRSVRAGGLFRPLLADQWVCWECLNFPFGRASERAARVWS